MADVGIIGVGTTQFRPETREKLFKELMYEAAYRAYLEAGVDPRRDVDAFITASEDLWEGLAIFDEYVPDQLGGVLKPVFTVGGDGIHGLIHGYMLIKTGRFDVVAVEAHSKASEIEDIKKVVRFALDPIYLRPVIEDVDVLAGLEMAASLGCYGIDMDTVNEVILKNHFNGSFNSAPYAQNLDENSFETPEYLAEPLRTLDVAPYVDGGAVVVLASKEYISREGLEPVWIEGVGWATQGGRFERFLDMPGEGLAAAARMAYDMAGVSRPRRYFDLAEVDDRFSFREPVSLIALGLASGDVNIDYADRVFEMDGELPVNVSGGFLANGYPLEAGGLMKLVYAARQIWGEAGPNQLDDVEKALVATRREIPSTTYGVVVLSG